MGISEYVTTTITKAFRFSQHQEKPRLLKISVSTESERPQFCEIYTKLRNSTSPPDIRKIYIMHI